MNTKEIQFEVSRNRYVATTGQTPKERHHFRLSLPVNMELLDEQTRCVVDHLGTSFVPGVNGAVHLLSRYTVRQIFKSMWDKAAIAEAANAMNCSDSWEDFEARAEQRLRRDYLDAYPSLFWDWDTLGDEETPEAYMTRHVHAMLELGDIELP